VLVAFLCLGFASCKAEGNGSANEVQSDSVAVTSDSQYIIQYQDDAFYKFLCSLPRKKRMAEIKNYKGEDAGMSYYKYCVIDFPLLSPVEQCADICMHLRAEYFYRQKQYDKIHFHDVGGKDHKYTGGASRQALNAYLKKIYNISNTASMYAEMQIVPSLSDIRPGDVLIYPAKGNKLGHVVMVSEVAKDAKGDIYFQVMQGFTPACELHIVKNNDISGNSPWFKLDPNADAIKIDNFTFRKDQLRRWK
jgi:hypothetical protein